MLNRTIFTLLLALALAPGFVGTPAFAAEDGWIPLFDGQTLTGWKAAEHPASFRAEGGAIVAEGPLAHLFYTGTAAAPADFRNFELRLEVLASGAPNSGVYFHTAFQERDFPRQGCEIQVNNTRRPQGSDYTELKMTGSLYGLRDVYKPLAADGAWFTLRAMVQGKRVRIWVGEALAVDYVEPTNTEILNSGGYDRRLGHGTFALQCHDTGGKVSFRNLRVRRLPDTTPLDAIAGAWDDVDQQILTLQHNNFPVVDYHVHLKGGLTLEEALARSRRLGIHYGIALNCGVGFPITDDQGISTALQSLAGAPIYIGMQAEGREWTRMFSPAAVARFDYVFTDGMTMTDQRGRRTRLWIKDEVEIPDKQDFMERLTRNIVTILNDEPIDIYVNPTYLPDALAPEYDALWTPERLKQVLDALVKNRVALEISNRYKLPKADFIKQAKAAGVKFTFGTNNADGNFGREEYALQMVRECALTWKDMWTPKPDGQKPVQVKGFKR